MHTTVTRCTHDTSTPPCSNSSEPVQAVTTGTDRKLAYWDAYDGSAVRVVDASDTAACTDVCVDPDGEAVVTGGADKLVQVRR